MSFIKILFNEFWLYMRSEFLTTSVTLNILLPCGALFPAKRIFILSSSASSESRIWPKTKDTTTTKRKLASAWLYGGKHMQDASLEMMGDQALHKDVSIKPELDNMLTF